jgi:hypothetical protein
MRPPVKVSTILAAICIGVAAVGCSGDDSEGTSDGTTTAAPQSRPVPKLVETTVVEGGSAREKSLLRSAVAGMEETSLKEITIGPAATRRDTDGGKAIAITFETIEAATVRRQWDQWIVSGAFSRRLVAAGLPAEVDAQDDRGGFSARPRLKGNPDPRPLAKKQEDAIVKALRNSAKKANAEVVTLEVHRPYGAAIALTLAPADTVSFLKTELRSFLQSLDAHRPKLEGIYVGVLDQERKLALEWGSWTRNPAGVYWVRRDLANCSPIRQSEPPGTKPPPACPT